MEYLNKLNWYQNSELSNMKDTQTFLQEDNLQVFIWKIGEVREVSEEVTAVKLRYCEEKMACYYLVLFLVINTESCLQVVA